MDNWFSFVADGSEWLPIAYLRIVVFNVILGCESVVLGTYRNKADGEWICPVRRLGTQVLMNYLAIFTIHFVYYRYVARKPHLTMLGCSRYSLALIYCSCPCMSHLLTFVTCGSPCLFSNTSMKGWPPATTISNSSCQKFLSKGCIMRFITQGSPGKPCLVKRFKWLLK